MLSRVAERTYWLARYLERAENTARLINVYSALLLDLPKSARLNWEVVLDITECREAFDATGEPKTDRAMLAFLLYSEANPGSLLSVLNNARENARTTRDIVPSEGWRAVNELCLFARERLPRATRERTRTQIMVHIVERVQGITGLLAGTMSTGQPYQFVRLGRNLERADMTTRTLDVAAALLMTGRPELQRYDNTLWMMVLRCLGAYQMYRQYVRRRVRDHNVIDFLLNDREFPRAVRNCARELGWALQQLPHADAAMEPIETMNQHLAQIDSANLSNQDLHRLLDSLQKELANIDSAIASAWFFPREPA